MKRFEFFAWPREKEEEKRSEWAIRVKPQEEGRARVSQARPKGLPSDLANVSSH